jgi:hypothetical protein
VSASSVTALVSQCRKLKILDLNWVWNVNDEVSSSFPHSSTPSTHSPSPSPFLLHLFLSTSFPLPFSLLPLLLFPSPSNCNVDHRSVIQFSHCTGGAHPQWLSTPQRPISLFSSQSEVAEGLSLCSISFPPLFHLSSFRSLPFSLSYLVSFRFFPAHTNTYQVVDLSRCEKLGTDAVLHLASSLPKLETMILLGIDAVTVHWAETVFSKQFPNIVIGFSL